MQRAKEKTEKEVTYTVNGKPVTTDKHVTVRQVLDAAGYDPATHYLSEVTPHGEKEHRDLDQKLTVKEGDEYLAYFTGTTPLS
jgi:sulfur carrier protein ThiS